MKIFITIVLLIFVFDLLDSSAGMGLGTLSAPVLFIMGYEPLQVIPVLVVDAAISGWISGWFHHEFKNVRFSLRRPLGEETKTLLFIAGAGCASIFTAVIITHYIVKLPDVVLKGYVGLLVIFMGFVGLLRVKSNQEHSYRPKFLALFATLAGMNKGIGGGGYGPVVVMGEIFSGVYEKTAAAISQTAEGIVSTVGAISFFTIMAGGVEVDLVLLPSMFTGTFFASILAPYFVRVLPNRIWRVLIPCYALIVGSIFLIKLLF